MDTSTRKSFRLQSGHALYFQYLALRYLLVRPAQAAHRLVRLLVAGIIDEVVTFQGAVNVLPAASSHLNSFVVAYQLSMSTVR